MSASKLQGAVIQTFLTHRMEDETVRALNTGRTRETEEVMDAVRRNLSFTPGLLQHIVIYAPRGFGKSFMTRVIQLETAALSSPERPIRYVLLPEEQRDVIRNPHALLDNMTSRLADQRLGEDRTWEKGFFRWPRPEEEAALWDASVSRLEAELDASLKLDANLGGEPGLVIAAVENFDTLLATVFKDTQTEQRLRKWLGRDGNRLMLLATGTRTADLDYDRPLFQAFQSVRLQPWTQEECIAYFNSRRKLEKREPLDAHAEPKARAIANFIGGNPRLAQLLGDVLDTEDALSVVVIMNALADKLADYYRRRIDDLPPLAQGLVDALIRGGEPCSATELARRVGAEQSDIARVMRDLRHADIIRGTPAPDSKETLFRVVDRVFVHYYRLRQLEGLVGQSPLETILDLLRSFYTREEQRGQAARYLELGRPNEAMVFSRLVLEGERDGGFKRYRSNFGYRLQRYLTAAPDVIGLSADAIMTMLDSGRPSDLHAYCTASPGAAKLAQAIHGALHGQVLCRMALVDEAEATLRRALDAVNDDPAAAFVAAEELGYFLYVERGDAARAKQLWTKFLPGVDEALPQSLMIRACLNHTWLLGIDPRTAADGLIWAENAAALAARAGDTSEQAEATRHKAYSLGQLGRHAEAIEAATEATALAARAGDTREQAMALLIASQSLAVNGRPEEAWITAMDAFEIAMAARDHAGADRAVWRALTIARGISRAECVPMFTRLVDLHQSGVTSEAPSPSALFDDLIAAVMRAQAWDAFDQFLTSHAEWIAANRDSLLTWLVGEALTAIARDEGRAVAFETAGQALRRLTLVFRGRDNTALDGNWLSPIVTAFARTCRDTGLMRDIAGLIEDQMAPDGTRLRSLLQRLADFDDGPGGEAGLARLDPDMAIWIRRMRDLPDTPPPRPAKAKPRGKKRG